MNKLDISQIRQSFLLSDTLGQRINEFRASRIASIIGDGAPVKLRDGLRVILHVIPISAFAAHQQLPVQDYRGLYLQLRPVVGRNIDYHLNCDGLVVASGTDRNTFLAYTQLFRSGVLEFVRVYEADGDEKYVPSASYEIELLKSYSAGLDVLRKLVIDAPLIVLVTLANAKGYRLGVGQVVRFLHEPIPFDRDVMLIPDVQVESLDRRDIDVLRPMPDIIWNAGGYERSLYFDENNNRKQLR